MNNHKRTKIIATLGPASSDIATLCRMIQAGTDLVRINFSHGTAVEHQHLIQLTRQCAIKVGREIGIIADLQGPKIRIGGFVNGKVTLHQGALFTLDATLDLASGTQHAVGIEYKNLLHDVVAGDTLLLDDGFLELCVTRIIDQQICCEVINGGVLSNNKGINRKGGGLSAPALTAKDKQDLALAVQAGVDYIAVSFPRNAADIIEARNLIKPHNTGIIAKIERTEALVHIDEIIEASDAIMVARGDLGVEIGAAEVPAAQKTIIHRSRSLNRAVITATQMMESMIKNQIPTRAEVSDVANAVLDGTDAVMLSAETATGLYPVSVVETVKQVCIAAEKNPLTHISRHRVECTFQFIDEAIAMATMYTANHMSIRAIVTLTESGATPLWMSRIRSGISIYAVTRNVQTLRKMSLYRGVYPISFDHTMLESPHTINQKIIELLQQLNLVSSGELIILTRGSKLGEPGGTNFMKIIKV